MNDTETNFLPSRTALLGYIRRKVTDPDLAEDILQESLLKALRTITGTKLLLVATRARTYSLRSHVVGKITSSMIDSCSTIDFRCGVKHHFYRTTSVKDGQLDSGYTNSHHSLSLIHVLYGAQKRSHCNRFRSTSSIQYTAVGAVP